MALSLRGAASIAVCTSPLLGAACDDDERTRAEHDASVDAIAHDAGRDASHGEGSDSAVRDAGGHDGGGSDGGDSGDAAVVDAGTCLPVPTDLSWLEEYQREVVAKLSGAREIARGVTITERFSGSSREHARTYLMKELARWGHEPRLDSYDSGANVTATMSASSGQQSIVILGAHLDGVRGVPAAADDGTGVAIVLAAARHFAGSCTKHRVQFMLFDEEELGLVGSGVAASALEASGANIAAVHAFDMISFDGDDDGALELWDASPSLATAYQAAGARLGVSIQVETCHCSDHQSFLDHGFTATGVGETFIGGDRNPNYHEPTDTFDNVDFAYLARSTELIFQVVAGQLAPE